MASFEENLKHFKIANLIDNKHAIIKCPAHNDKVASATATESDNGNTLLYCHAGCSTEEMCKKAGLKMSDLFLDKPKQTERKERKPIAQYRYTDINGNLLNQKTRWIDNNGDKSFSWSHKVNGRWVKGHQGSPMLYNMPVLKNCNDIYVVEGEKDVDSLSGLGLAAVCGAHGAGHNKWLPQYTDALKGKNIIVLQDNDDIGKAFAVETCNALSSNAASVKLIDLTKEWTGLKNHGDISDVLESEQPETVINKLQRLVSETEQFQPIEQSDLSNEEIPDFFDGKRFLHHIMGDYLIKKFSVCKINDTIHIYNNGVYERGEDILHGHMIKLMPDITDARRREVYKYIKVSLTTPTKEVAPPHFIPFATKIYDLNTDKFLDYMPDYVFLNRFPYDYKPDAPPQNIVTETISQIASGDQDVINLLYEAIGNCFYLLNSYRGSVMLYGKSGNNGKSTLLNMIIKVLGSKNTSSLSLQDTAERFRLAEIYGKAANIGDDISSAYLPDSSTFKKLVTGEVVMAEKKGQDPFAFKPFAKMFFAMNELPASSDKSKAFFSRILLIPLNQDFSKLKTMNADLKNRTWTQEEMEYLTKLAVDGLKRLRKNGDFTKPQSVIEAVEEYERENDPVKGFLEEYNDIEGQPIQNVYADFQDWCDESGYKYCGRSKFTRRICDVTGLKSEPRRTDTGTARCFVNF